MSNDKTRSALRVISEQLDEAIAARKCHPCGCLHQAVEALSNSAAAQDPEVSRKLSESRQVFKPKRYDCIGCPVCYPAIAANAFAEAFPLAATLDTCPTGEPQAREGWPPLPGDYSVVRYTAPAAVCTLNDDRLSKQLAEKRADGVSIVGTLRTENLGIERMIANVLANPNIRFLVLCGADSQQAIGHLPGQSLLSLARYGADERGRIMGAKGKRPILKNLDREAVEHFRKSVELVDLIGVDDAGKILSQISGCAARNPGPTEPFHSIQTLRPVAGYLPERMTSDPAGYFVVYVDLARGSLALEHIGNNGALDTVIEGHSAAELYTPAIEKGLLSRLDHAAYLGRELARAEHSLKSGEPYVQDAAPERALEPASTRSCGCSSVCEEKQP